MQLSSFELAVLLTYVGFIYTSESMNLNYSQIFLKSEIISNSAVILFIRFFFSFFFIKCMQPMAMTLSRRCVYSKLHVI